MAVSHYFVTSNL